MRSMLLLTFMVMPLSFISIVLSGDTALGSSTKVLTTGSFSEISSFTTSCFSETGIILDGTVAQASALNLVTQW